MTEETIKQILKFRDDRDWKQFHNPKDLAISISLEAAELLEVFQGIQEDIQNKNSYRPHVRSEAGYDITQTTVVIKTTAESGK